MEMPLLSILTPAYNEEPYLAAMVESLRAQTDGRWELLLLTSLPYALLRNLAVVLVRPGDDRKTVGIFGRDSEVVPERVNHGR